MTLTTHFPPRSRRFTRDEYHRMAAEGFFQNQHVELIDGEVIEMAPQNEPHVEMISRLIRLLAPTLPTGFELRCQAPLSIGNSEPEPDIAIIKLPKPKDTAPTTAALVIEVADSSLPIDRKKAHLYASAQIPEYWLLNLIDRRLERFLDPLTDPASPFAAAYASATALGLKDSIQPTAFPLAPLPVGKLFDPGT
ncbi:MAG TPA: Uma2 family endonuclease [Phycisphaerae bacterium]|nr:Uma2 family endonuclease [Phycisphaerae bacterium]